MAKRKPKPSTRDRLIAALLKRARVTLVREHEPLVIEGNASAIDEQTDREQEQWIRDQLDAGNDWAWCAVHVRASFRGFHGDDFLGACSYLSEADFRKDAYYADMVHTACANLADQLIEAGEALADLIGGKP